MGWIASGSSYRRQSELSLLGQQVPGHLAVWPRCVGFLPTPCCLNLQRRTQPPLQHESLEGRPRALLRGFCPALSTDPGVQEQPSDCAPCGWAGAQGGGQDAIAVRWAGKEWPRDEPGLMQRTQWGSVPLSPVTLGGSFMPLNSVSMCR